MTARQIASGALQRPSNLTSCGGIAKRFLRHSVITFANENSIRTGPRRDAPAAVNFPPLVRYLVKLTRVAVDVAVTLRRGPLCLLFVCSLIGFREHNRIDRLSARGHAYERIPSLKFFTNVLNAI
ncbi:hypothetical protein EVAR_83952_1 [Eumeta japonica]|uniref:Uncharacterized protein n=1 Tax=Eumeta variegata TaxID=151549 RepID=A0A4C1VPC5_EUMVA|nr:hypothetical protein EVAR_83952_1 [Eumeta japonica]